MDDLPFIEPRPRTKRERKSALLHFRVTPRQVAALDAAAARAGQSRPDWLRTQWSRCRWDVEPLSEASSTLLRRVAEPLNYAAHQLNLAAKDPKVPAVPLERLEVLAKAFELQVLPALEQELQGQPGLQPKLRCGEVSSDFPIAELQSLYVRVTPTLRDHMQRFIAASPSRQMQTALENHLFGRLVPAENARMWRELAASTANLTQIEQHVRGRDLALADRYLQVRDRFQGVRRRLLGVVAV